MTRDAGELFIGIDGGGSGCRVSIRAGGGRELGHATGGPANAMTDTRAATANVTAAIALSCAAAGLGRADLAGARAHAGLAGVITDRIADTVAADLTRAFPGVAFTVSDDREIQALGALGGRDGFLLAIGTGSIVARVRDTRVQGVGGWGFVLSDQGSGADLGRHALSRTLLALDGLSAGTDLTDGLARRFGGAAGLVSFARHATPADFAALAPMVADAADAGDATAVEIMDAGAEYLDAALAVLGFGPGQPLCLTGGFGPRYRRRLRACRDGQVLTPRGSALDGAILRAEGKLTATDLPR